MKNKKEIKKILQDLERYFCDDEKISFLENSIIDLNFFILNGKAQIEMTTSNDREYYSYLSYNFSFDEMKEYARQNKMQIKYFEPWFNGKIEIFNFEKNIFESKFIK